MRRWAACVLTVFGLTGCATTVTGVPTWPGATLERAVLTEADFPPGVYYDRIIEQPGQPDGAGAPPPMLSTPPGCTDGLTKVIAASAERGPGSAAKYNVIYDGARIAVTVLSWNLDLEKLDATAARCASFEAFFDPQSPGIPMTTERLPAGAEELRYQQTMTLAGRDSSVYMVFANVGALGLVGMASSLESPDIPAKAQLPQTFLEITEQQADRLRQR